MIEQSQPIESPEEIPSITSQHFDSISQPKRSKKKIWIIVGIALAILLLCSIICVAVFGIGMYRISIEKAPIEAVLDDYMQHMANKDADSAYALFSPRAQRQIPISKIQEMLEGNNYILFEGYQSLSVSNINISAVANANPDVPQGTVANVTGIISFEGGIQGSFNGILEKVDGKWLIDGIHVTVPPNKIK
jgi:hypothetical protein